MNMKNIIIVLMLLALSACAPNAPISKASIDKAIEKCSTAEGLSSVYYDRRAGGMKVWCNDGSFIFFKPL